MVKYDESVLRALVDRKTFCQLIIIAKDQHFYEKKYIFIWNEIIWFALEKAGKMWNDERHRGMITDLLWAHTEDMKLKGP